MILTGLMTDLMGPYKLRSFLKSTLLTISLGLIANNGFAQDKPTANDTIPLTLNDLLDQVVAFHPFARQIDLMGDNAREELRLARGGFDPKLSSEFSQKVFKDQNYYEIWASELKIPAWAFDIKAGYEQNDGIQLNDENDTNSGQGLAHIGLSVPLGQGLFIDNRRATLQKAKGFQLITVADQRKELNKLILQVAKDYWEWYYAYHQYRLTHIGFDLANFRFRAVKERVTQGDLAPIDSVEAKITIQEREIDYRQAEIALQNARLLLSNHLWLEGNLPAELTSNMVPAEEIPPVFTIDELQVFKEFAQRNHPEIRKIILKSGLLDIERRMASEMLKPQIDLEYKYLMTRPIDGPGNELNDAFFGEDYKAGVKFAIPLFLRKERAKLQQVKIKINQNDLELVEQQRRIINNIHALHNETVNLQELMGTQSDMAVNYQILLSGERQKFQQGESSVFLVNVREGKMLEAQIKLFDMRKKYAKSLSELRWAAGMGWGE